MVLGNVDRSGGAGGLGCGQTLKMSAGQLDGEMAKSARPRIRTSGGMMMSFTREETALPKAPPLITPTARSTTLPRGKKKIFPGGRNWTFHIVLLYPLEDWSKQTRGRVRMAADQ